MGAIQIAAANVQLNVDYTAFDTEDELSIIVATDSFTIQNSDAVDANVALSVAGLPVGYSAETKQVTVPANSSVQASLNVNVTHEKAPGEVQIGTIQAVSGTTTLSIPLVQKTKNMLIIKEIEVSYTDDTDDSQKDDFNPQTSNNTNLDQPVKIGTEVVITLEVENRFNDEDYDEGEIQDVELKLEASDDDLFGDDFDDEYDLDDLKPDENQKITLQFTTPEDLDEGDYEIEFTLEGEDGKSVPYSQTAKISLDLQRMKDDLRITKLALSPIRIDNCAAQAVTLDFQMKNFGTDDQRDAAFSVFNSYLKINENVANIRINEFDDNEDTYSKLFSWNIAKSTAPGTYPLEIRTFINDDDLMDTEKVDLAVEKCAPVETPPPSNGTTAAGSAATVTSTGITGTTGGSSTTTSTPASGTQSRIQTTLTAATPSSAPAATLASTTSEIVQVTESGYQTDDYLLGAMAAVMVLLFGLIVMFAVVLWR